MFNDERSRASSIQQELSELREAVRRRTTTTTTTTTTTSAAAAAAALFLLLLFLLSYFALASLHFPHIPPHFCPFLCRLPLAYSLLRVFPFRPD
jgi:hypothetical protein